MFQHLYTVTKDNLAFMPDGKSFIRNDAYANIADTVRTSIYAPSSIENMATEYGTLYVLWTKSSGYEYQNTAYLDEGEDLRVEIELTHVDLVTFHLRIAFKSVADGTIYATCKQRIVAQDAQSGRPISWKKVPALNAFVMRGLTTEEQEAA